MGIHILPMLEPQYGNTHSTKSAFQPTLAFSLRAFTRKRERRIDKSTATCYDYAAHVACPKDNKLYTGGKNAQTQARTTRQRDH